MIPSGCPAYGGSQNASAGLMAYHTNLEDKVLTGSPVANLNEGVG